MYFLRLLMKENSFPQENRLIVKTENKQNNKRL